MSRAQWAFLGGLANGGLSEYHRMQQEKRLERQDDRQAELQAAQLARQKRMDAQAEEVHSINMQNALRVQAKQKQEDDIEQAYADAFAAGTPQSGSVVNGGIANQAIVNNPENAQTVADFAAEPGVPSEVQQPAGATKPTVKPAAWVPQADGTKKLYTGLSAATDAAKFAKDNPMSSISRYQSLYDRVAAMPGGAKYADQIMAKVKQAQSEGAFQALNLAQAGRTEEALKLFNSGGLIKTNEGDYLAQDPIKKSAITGKPLVKLLSKDGKPVIEDAEAALFGFMFSPAAAYKMEIDNYQARLKAREKAEAEEKARRERLEDRKEMALFAAGLHGAAGGGRGRGSAGADSVGGLPSPLEDFDAKTAWNGAMDLAKKRAEIVAASDPSKAWTDDQVVQEANRLFRVARADYANVGTQSITIQAFKNSAAKAVTPQQIATVRQQAQALGMSDDEIIAHGGEKFAPQYPKVPVESDAVGNLAVKKYGANTWANRQRAYNDLRATLSK